ncbi:unnamed protein product [Prunus armeniaca]
MAPQQLGNPKASSSLDLISSILLESTRRRKEVRLHLRWPEITITDDGAAPLLQTCDAHNVLDEMRKPLLPAGGDAARSAQRARECVCITRILQFFFFLSTPIQTLSILVRSVANSRRKRLRDTLFERKSLNLPSNNLGSSNPPSSHLSSSNPPSNNPASSNPPSNNPASSNQPSNNPPTELDEILANLPAYPGLRPPMTYYNPNFREQIRRAYLQREYSKEKDAAFCLHCYLFKCDFDKQGKAGSDVFTEKGFKNWRKGPENFRDHVGQVGSLHNKATQHCIDLMNQKQHVETIVIKQTDQARVNYRILLTAALDCTRYLLRQGLPFRGHDESETSSNKGNYVELLQFLADHDEKVRAVVFENAPGNLKYIAPNIQKELVNSCAIETIDAIIRDIDDAFFSILVDESRDVSIREQMAVVLRYVNKKGQVIERFVGVQYVSDTTSSKLKEAIEQLISSTNLSMSRLRGQGYDGASNMRGELNGLKTQILREYPQAYYVHCFAHQLQLALVAVAKGNENIATFFTTASSVVNIIGASCKRRDALREQQQKDIMKALEIDDLETG